MSASELMQNPLIIWAHTFSSQTLTSKDFVDGVFLNSVIKQIDQKASTDAVTLVVDDYKDRLHNWDILLKNVKAYYQDVLQQFIVTKLPHIVTICRDPDSGRSHAEVLRALLLILGCAVQCDRKEEFIDNIQRLDVHVQHDIVACIKEITDDTKNVCPLDLPPGVEDDFVVNVHRHIRNLVAERDDYIDEMRDMSVTVDDLTRAHQELQVQLLHKGADVTRSSSPEKHHMVVEVAELKSKVRRLKQELEEKTELVHELQDELLEERVGAQKLRTENLELTQDARAARAYRDELDIWKDKASVAEKLEGVISKYKDRLGELDFYKARVEELREDNSVLLETRYMLEEQLETCHKKIATVIDLESELVRCKHQLESMSAELNADKQRISDLIGEKAVLESEFRNAKELYSEDELKKMRQHLEDGGTLSDQLNNTASAKILRLELDNQKLKKQLLDMEENRMLENASRIVELEKENSRLAKKVDKLQDSSAKETQHLLAAEQKVETVQREKQILSDTLSTVKEALERQQLEWEREREQLTGMVETLRERSEKTQDLKTKDLEDDNRRLNERMQEVTHASAKLEYDNRQLQKTVESLKTQADKAKDLMEEQEKIEREKSDLNREVIALRMTCERLEKVEQDYSDLLAEKHRQTREVDSLKKSIARLEHVDQDNMTLMVEMQQLKKAAESNKFLSERIAYLEQEREEMSKEFQNHKSSVELAKEIAVKQEKAELLEATAEVAKLKKSLETSVSKCRELEKEVRELEKQNETLTIHQDNALNVVKKVEEREKEVLKLEADIVALQKEKSAAEKESRKLKSSLERREATIEELTKSVSSLEHENRVMKKTIEKSEDIENKVADLENANISLQQQSAVDRKTLNDVREEMVMEKVQGQQMARDLQKLTTQLAAVGISKEKLLAADYPKTEGVFKALEAVLTDTVRRGLEQQHEQVSLENRLLELQQAAGNGNVNEQLLVHEHNGILMSSPNGKNGDGSYLADGSLYDGGREFSRNQTSTPRLLRETSIDGVDGSSHADGSRMSSVGLQLHGQLAASTKDILNLKDHVISVERNNAKLDAENRLLRQQCANVQKRLDQSESQVQKLQGQITSGHGRSAELQVQLARCQVELTTLQSQNAALIKQNAVMQRQLSQLESTYEKLLRQLEEMTREKESLTSDNDKLRQLYDNLTIEYERMSTENGAMKLSLKTERSQRREVEDRYHNMSREAETVAQLKQHLMSEATTRQTDARYLHDARVEHLNLREQNLQLQNANDKLQRDHKDLLADYKAAKMELNEVKSRYEELKSKNVECQAGLSAMDLELSKLNARYEALSQLNTSLEEENRQLMMQVKTLLSQHQEMLVQALQSKDHYAEEQKLYMERLSDLKRQKEKLEEKIMDQYKRYDPVKKKNRGFFPNFMKKLVGKSNKPTNRQGDYSFQEGAENTSVGSAGSLGDGVDAPASGRKSADFINERHMYETPPSPRTLPRKPDSSKAGGARSVLMMPRSATIGEDDDGMLSLMQFLRECDLSPKSRRKYKDSVEKKSRKMSADAGKPLTEALDPRMGAREPTIQPDRPPSSMAARMSKSELNLSGITPLPHAAAAANNGAYTLGRNSMRTSQSYTAAHPLDQQQSGLVRQLSMPRHGTERTNSISNSNGSSSAMGTADGTASPCVLYQKPCDCPPVPVVKQSSQSSGSQRNMEETHNGSYPVYHTSLAPAHSYNADGVSSNHNSNSRPKPLVAAYDGNQPEVTFTPVLGTRNGPHRGSLYSSNNVQHQAQSQQKQPPSSPPDEQYDKNNIRNLVQNYQRTVQQVQPSPSNASINSRRMRPSSAGPPRTGSAFSVPQPQQSGGSTQENVYASIGDTEKHMRSVTPGPELRFGSGSLSVADPLRSSGRALPRTPLASSTPTAEHSAVPQPLQSVAGPERRKSTNKVMYEGHV